MPSNRTETHQTWHPGPGDTPEAIAAAIARVRDRPPQPGLTRTPTGYPAPTPFARKRSG